MELKNTRNVDQYVFGSGAVKQLGGVLKTRFYDLRPCCVYCVDSFFEGSDLLGRLPISSNDQVLFINTVDEPKTTLIDSLVEKIISQSKGDIDCVIGVGGGIVLDVAKAIANMLTNDGPAQDYQGWDLLKHPAIYKIGIPTLSGTGSEASRTCILTNVEKGIKLGMNSDYTLFDQLILDPDLTATVPREQYFYTGMDTYLHCMESLRGSYRNAIVDALSQKAIDLCREVFLSDDMQSAQNRERMMIASYFGGCAAGNVGVVHPLSAGLSVALGTHHGIANCIVMNVMDEFYPSEYKEFVAMKIKQNVDVPSAVCADLTPAQYEQLFASSICHEKPLKNALGENFRDILTKEKMISIFKRM